MSKFLSIVWQFFINFYNFFFFWRKTFENLNKILSNKILCKFFENLIIKPIIGIIWTLYQFFRRICLAYLNKNIFVLILKKQKKKKKVHVWIAFMASVCAFCWKYVGSMAQFTDPQKSSKQNFNINLSPTILFTHLKIILLQCFQFSVNKRYPNTP